MRTGEEKVEGTHTAVGNFESAFFDADEALQVPTFQADREVITKAVELVRASYLEARAMVAKNRLIRHIFLAFLRRAIALLLSFPCRKQHYMDLDYFSTTRIYHLARTRPLWLRCSYLYNCYIHLNMFSVVRFLCYISAGMCAA